FVLQPSKPLPDPDLIPRLFRTKSIPELEEKQREIVQAYHESTPGSLDQKRITLLDQITNYNSMCNEIEEYFDEQREELVEQMKATRSSLRAAYESPSAAVDSSSSQRILDS